MFNSVADNNFIGISKLVFKVLFKADIYIVQVLIIFAALQGIELFAKLLFNLGCVFYIPGFQNVKRCQVCIQFSYLPPILFKVVFFIKWLNGLIFRSMRKLQGYSSLPFRLDLLFFLAHFVFQILKKLRPVVLAFDPPIDTAHDCAHNAAHWPTKRPDEEANCSPRSTTCQTHPELACTELKRSLILSFCHLALLELPII